MQTLGLKPTHKPVKDYFAALAAFQQLSFGNEGTVRSAFQELLADCSRKLKWTLVPEYPFKGPKGTTLRADGAVLDSFHYRRGIWEAKDEQDDLIKEVRKKFEIGYPKDNTLFQGPERAILYQNGILKYDGDISQAQYLADIVNEFFNFSQPHIAEWEEAIEEFKDRIPELAAALEKTIDREMMENRRFVARFEEFVQVCRASINPQISPDSVKKMLIQHLLTERIFRRVFKNPDFTRKNIIAFEIEKVIDALTSRQFSRDEFLKSLDRFYNAIEKSAEHATDYSEKQQFLNTVYERFFQGWDAKQADTHGIVYTPQPIVDFMVRSVEEILKKEFGKSLSDEGVHILDPFVGTGNFIVRVMKEIRTTNLKHKYLNELHCNEIMLLPYYIASMNIEHEYHERTGQYEPFPGICLVDTFELAEDVQGGLFTEENTARVERQRKAPIKVIIGNPPYNAWQENEDDGNKNRKYKVLDRRVSDTYSKLSNAANRNALSDPYVKAIRWASDRVGSDGIVALITNSGFLDAKAADGFRKCLGDDFSSIYIVDLGANVRKNPKLSGTTHNVFGIQVGVSINFFIRRKDVSKGELFYASADEWWTKLQRLGWLNSIGDSSRMQWVNLTADAKGNWLSEGIEPDFETYPSIEDIFSIHSNGLKTNRDAWAYNFSKGILAVNIKRTIGYFNAESSRIAKIKGSGDDLVASEDSIAWSRDLKNDALGGHPLAYSERCLRAATYRPFCRQIVYFDSILNEELYNLPKLFREDQPNRALWLKSGSDWPFFVLATDKICDVLPQGGSKLFSLHRLGKDELKLDNIKESVLIQFRAHYNDKAIAKEDIFYYVYGVLHSPEYRERYAANLKRELPRVPYAPDFWAFSKAGRALAELHIDYEKQKQYPLEFVETGQRDLRVKKMRLSKDKTTLVYNEFLTLKGIPAEAFEYRLGNRSALEWVVDQYQVSTDKRSGIVNDPNREDDDMYILRLVGQVITVSLETMKIVKALPGFGLEKAEAAKQ